MIQFNLLPDVKLQYIKAQKLKHTISVLAGLVTIVVVGITVLLLFYTNVVQAKLLSDANGNIKKDTNTLNSNQNLTKILTVQSQLQSLPGLHDKKPISSRLFTYLTQLTPSNVSIASANADFTADTLSISGTADALSSVNTFVDTLKFAKYQKVDSTTQTSAFSKVVLSSFSRNDKDASYSIVMSFDPTVFDGNTTVNLIVPNQVTTRSETEKPSSLFQPQSTPTIPTTKKAGQ